jgi:hypothetical protein
MNTRKRVLTQDLSGPIESAELNAIFTWAKDEEAYIVSEMFDYSIFKVKFTGNNSLKESHLGTRTKAYEVEVVSTSDVGDTFISEVCVFNEDQFIENLDDAKKISIEKLHQKLKHETAEFLEKVKEIANYNGKNA